MAVVKMGQIKASLPKALAYITRPDATNDGLWVSTNAAVIDPSDWKAVAHQMASTAERVGVSKNRDGGVLAHHVIQSFAPGEKVQLEDAHRIGVQLAEQITGGQHEYVIATHLDKDHVHNHIIFNATSFETGRKFRCVRSTIGSIRDMSDDLCRDSGLSILPTPSRATGRSLGDIYKTIKGQSDKELLRIEIDKAATAATTWDEFEASLRRSGVVVFRRSGVNGTTTFRGHNMKRPMRDYRLGEAYTEEGIMARLARGGVNRITVDQSMMVTQTRDTMTVFVPGTGRRLRMTVSKRQIVKHGRSMRVYVPSEGQHVLADRYGRLAATVNTDGLYKWFSEPDLVGAVKQKTAQPNSIFEMKVWGEALSDLHLLEDRINAKARWMDNGQLDAKHALVGAREELARTKLSFQTGLVAATDLVANGDTGSNLAVLQAELRMTERDIDRLKTDVRALTVLTREETKMAMGDQIEQRLSQRRRDDSRRREEAAQRQRITDQAEDRETPGHQMNKDGEMYAQETRIGDQGRDRDGGTGRDTGMSLAERIEAEVQRRRTGRSDFGTEDYRGGLTR